MADEGPQTPVELREFERMMYRSCERCLTLADGEKVMGFVGNYETYLAIAHEVRYLPAWMQQTYGSL